MRLEAFFVVYLQRHKQSAAAKMQNTAKYITKYTDDDIVVTIKLCGKYVPGELQSETYCTCCGGPW